jgi:hypothetical protein
MIDLQTIKERTQEQDLWTFAEFVIAEAEGKNYPDYKAMDLMKIAHIVSYTWVFDFRNGLDDGLLFHFTGTATDSHFGRTLTGLDFEKVYPGEYFEELIENTLHQAFIQKRPCYTRRSECYHDNLIEKYNTIESIMFPCSSDDKNINFGLGLTKYIHSKHEGEPEFVLL